MESLKHIISVDASYDETRRITGIGIVIREVQNPKKRRGKVIDEISEAYLGIPGGSGEKFAILRALEIASERGYRIVKVRSDYNAMRKRLKKDYKGNTDRERDGLHATILRLAKTFAEVKFAYQARRKNQNAHRLARRAITEMVPQLGTDRSMKESC